MPGTPPRVLGCTVCRCCRTRHGRAGWTCFVAAECFCGTGPGTRGPACAVPAQQVCLLCRPRCRHMARAATPEGLQREMVQGGQLQVPCTCHGVCRFSISQNNAESPSTATYLPLTRFA